VAAARTKFYERLELIDANDVKVTGPLAESRPSNHSTSFGSPWWHAILLSQEQTL
jgi:hypothetical protein